MQKNNDNNNGFSLVELIISIVVIGILVAIVAISYGGIAKRAAGESVKSDTLAASSVLSKFKADRGVYPASLRCDIPDSATNVCVKKSSTDIEFNYSVNTDTSPDTYGLTLVKNNDNDLSYRTVNGSEPILCPVGYIVVPGSKTYNTGSFCVMKYEAKQVGSNGIPVSTATDNIWVNISQTNAIAAAKKSCSGCHLISEAEWLSIAQNIISLPSNWSGGAVGSGYIYGGHNDNIPPNPLAAGADDNGYKDTGDTSGNQKRTLTLSNGEVIWDLSGNVRELTSGQVSGGQPGIVGLGYDFREWTGGLTAGTISPDPHPGYVNPLGTTWNSDQGIGKTWLSADDNGLKVLVRSGYWGDGQDNAGILMLVSGYATSSVNPFIGFRVTR